MVNCCCLCRTVSAWLLSIHSEWNHLMNLIMLETVTSLEQVMSGTHNQLFFSCTLCPTGSMDDSQAHKQVSLVFFSAFEPISLTPDSCMQRKGVPILYERVANQVPTLYVCPVENVLGRVPLLPGPAMLLEGQHSQYHPTQLQVSNSKGSCC